MNRLTGVLTCCRNCSSPRGFLGTAGAAGAAASAASGREGNTADGAVDCLAAVDTATAVADTDDG